MQPAWYVLRSKPRKEDLLYHHACGRGFEMFYPRIPVQTVNPRARQVVPYFPGYMFVRADLSETGMAAFQWMPNAHGLVCFADTPAAVPDEIIAAIRQRTIEIITAGGELLIELQRGDRVLVKSGAFAGYEAIFDARLNGNGRVRVLLDMLNDRTVPLDLHAGQLARAR